MQIFLFPKNVILWSIQGCFLSNITKLLFSSYFEQKERIKKFQIFDPNDGPLEKCTFLDLLILIFLWFIKVTFFLQQSQFSTKPQANPSGKKQILGHFQVGVFMV